METNLLTILRINSAVAGMLISLGIYIQCFRVFRSRSAKDFSPALVIALIYFEVSWLAYGISINEYPVISMTAATLPADIGIAIGYLLYGRKPNKAKSETRQ